MLFNIYFVLQSHHLERGEVRSIIAFFVNGEGVSKENANDGGESREARNNDRWGIGNIYIYIYIYLPTDLHIRR